MAGQPFRHQLLAVGEALTMAPMSNVPGEGGLQPFVRNPLVNAEILEHQGAPHRVAVSAYSVVRGFDRVLIGQGEPGFEAALVLLATPDTAPVPDIPSRDMLALWAAGLLVLPQERPEFAVPLATDETIAAFRMNGFADLQHCIDAALREALVKHYRHLVGAGDGLANDARAERYAAHNDPAGRIVQRLLAPLAAGVIGGAIKPSYAFASLYRGGAALRVHRDRPQCEYTLSLLIEHAEAGPDGLSPWPIQLYPEAGAPPIECFQRAGGGLLFRGCDIPHGRSALPVDQSCWVMLLHYVDASFDGSLD